jgi:hypothetical protein
MLDRGCVPVRAMATGVRGGEYVSSGYPWLFHLSAFISRIF